jgi:hypothetical protein
MTNLPGKLGTILEKAFEKREPKDGETTNRIPCSGSSSSSEYSG